jgi:poly(3-hydroxybutyrate) depolymerase
MAVRYTLSLFLLASTISTGLASSSAGCGKALPAAQSPAGGASHQTDFTQSDGTARTYLIHIPTNYNKTNPVPLILSFHGRGKSSSEQEQLSQFSNEAFNPNAIAVYPQGLDVSVFSKEQHSNTHNL